MSTAEAAGKRIDASQVPCCPELDDAPCCDRVVVHYRLTHRVRDIAVEVKLEAVLERCPGPLTLGDLVYSTTLLPGERVRLVSSSRKTRFTFDSESRVSYRHEQASEESYYMSSMSRFLSDLSVREDVSDQLSSSGSFKTDGSVSGAIESFLFGPSASAKGSYNAASTRDFARELKSHAEAAHASSIQATRAANSISIGEVQSRTHAAGETEDSFEAATRTFSNPNRCHAVTYFAYQINKTQKIRFHIVAIQRRVVDPAGDSKVTLNPPRFAGEVSVIPQGILATDAKRVAVESVGRASYVADQAGVLSTGGESAAISAPSLEARIVAGRDLQLGQGVRAVTPLPDKLRAAALEEVDKDLVSAGLLDRIGGHLAPEAAVELGFELETCLPTSAVLVKGCLDKCDVCEPTLQREIELELARKDLENKLLQRRIDLLEKAQEYRCCPKGEVEAEEEGDGS